MKIEYFIYDERYYTDPDSATVYEVCETLKEARENGPDYGGHVIVKVTSERISKKSFRIVNEKIVT